MSRTLRQKKIFSKRAPSIVDTEEDVREQSPRGRVDQKGIKSGYGNYGSGGCGTGNCGGCGGGGCGGGGCGGGGSCSRECHEQTPIDYGCQSVIDSSIPLGDQSSLCLDGSYLTEMSIDYINGTCGAPNPKFFAPCGVPGSRFNPFGRFQFYIEYANGGGAPWMARLFSPIGLTEANGICLSVNQVAGRSLAMIKGRKYNFIVAPLDISGVFPRRDGPLDQLNTAVAFTIDPALGGITNQLNRNAVSDFSESKGIMVPTLNGTPIMYPGNAYSVCLGSATPFVFFYGSFFATFMGGPVVSLGCCPDDYLQYPLGDALPCGY